MLGSTEHKAVKKNVAQKAFFGRDVHGSESNHIAFRQRAMARSLWPAAKIIVAGDDDRLTTGNPGLTKAREAAIAADALLALPQWPSGAPESLTDFNDLAIWRAGGAS